MTPMKRFAVRYVPLTTSSFVVEAPDELAAGHVACAHVAQGGTLLECRETDAPDARPVTYVCLWCGESSPKHMWGPGRITCPRCRRVAPSAAEQQAMLDPLTGDPAPV